MTLHRQLLITILFIYALLLFGVFSLELRNTYDYLTLQLASDVDNTGTSLGLSLTPYIESQDMVGAETVVNAMFDGGFYEKIEVEIYQDPPVSIHRKNISGAQGVPLWFETLLPLPELESKQVLTSGWMQMAQVTVVGHRGLAYQKLWQLVIDLASIFIIGYLITVLLLMRALRYLLGPLDAIRKQAIAISRREYQQALAKPKTKELIDVVDAMNVMAESIERQFNEQLLETEQLRRSAYLDAVSGLSNRKHFMQQAEVQIDEFGHGSLILIKIPVLTDIYQQFGFDYRDNSIKKLADALIENVAFESESLLARISSDEFVLLLPLLHGEELKTYLGKLIPKLKDILSIDTTVQTQSLVIGCCEFEPKAQLKVGELLNVADSALQRAVQNSQPYATEALQAQSKGRLEWKAIIEQAIKNDDIEFSQQMVSYYPNATIRRSSSETLHYELFSQIRIEGELVKAASFISALEQFGLGADFDKAVLRILAKRLESKPGSESLAVNLSLSALRDPKFIQWLAVFAPQHRSFMARLCFDIPEQYFVSDDFDSLLKVLRRNNIRFGIDQFARNLQQLRYLKKVQPDYVKIDFSYAHNAIESEQQAMVLNGLCRAVHAIDVVAIAQRIEDDNKVKALQNLALDAYQGYVDPETPLLFEMKS
ncbi:EAL domain-containing protein [Alginatibacterium sediminis]|uniref:EAL domain-containing protein n=1 Tax=Alginatibacterium sediminis TaxID=2164068 RepID=A0A420E5U6_9ALTE|nr:EAL domain-containing protein [Alginatibacterium sediminis]RKF12820.1 EAL domain-containing protein [Alginatibacterium sediminis]